VNGAEGLHRRAKDGAVKLPIDTSGMTFMAAAPARPVTDFETRQPKTDENGELLFNLQVVALDPEGAQIITVKTPGDPQVGQGALLELEGLVAMPWAMNERSGVAFRANRIKTIGVAGASPNGRASEKAAA
jgi:hypothetical protein